MIDLRKFLFIDKESGKVYKWGGTNIKTCKYKFYPKVKAIELNHQEMLKKFNLREIKK